MKFLIFIIIFTIIWFKIMESWFRYNAKKSNYDCKKCKAFDCARKFCGKEEE